MLCMTTYAQLKTQIENELDASELSDEISLAVHSAIRFYEAEHNYLAEVRATAPTEIAQQYYSMPDDFVELDALNVTVNLHTYPVNIRTPQWMDAHYDSVSTYTGAPVDASIYGQELRLQPVPDATYTLEMAYRYTIAPPLSASDSNVWTNQLQDLVRSRAKWDVFLNTMQDPERAQGQKQAEMEAFDMAERKRLRSMRSGKITPTYF